MAKKRVVAKRVAKKSVREMPTGVKVLSILYYIGAAMCVLFGLLFMAGAGFMAALLKSFPRLSFLGTGFFMGLGIILIAFGVLDFFVGRGLWNGQNWARILTIVFSALGVLGGLSSLVRFNLSGIVGLAIHALIIYYLGFSKEGKSAFV